MPDFRSLRWWTVLHRWSSLVCTVFLLLLCITGLPLIFSDEIEAWSATRPPLARLAPGETALSIDRLVALARERYPAEVVRFVFIDGDEPVIKVVMAPADSPNRRLDHRIEFDARSGAVLDDAPSAQARPPGGMGTLLRLHTDLFAGSMGEYLLALVGLLFLLALVSGAVLYAPFMRKLAFGTIRRRGARIAWLDRHNLLGIGTLAWALVVGLTGVLNELSKPLSAHWRGTQMSALLRAYQDLPPVAHAQAAPAQAAHDAVRRALPGRNVTSVIFPSRSFSNPHHYLVWTNGNTPLTYRLFTAALVDARDGSLTAVAPMPLYLRVLQVSRPLHFGDYGGLPMKVLWALLDVATIVVLGSGLYLWLARWRQERRRARGAGARSTGP